MEKVKVLNLYAGIGGEIAEGNFALTFCGFALVPPCTMFDFSTKLSGGITPNRCYLSVFLTLREAN